MDKTPGDSVSLQQGDGIDVYDPVTSDLIGTVPRTSRAEVETAVNRARIAQHAWAAMSVKDRCRILRRWGDLIWAQQAELMRIIRQETGKTDTGAFAELVGIDATVNYLVYYAPRFLRTKRRPAILPLIQRGRVHYKPHGVAGFITPWNYPFYLAVIDVIPALVAGNSVVIKPSELTPYSTLYAIELFERAGVPPNVVQAVTGDGSTGEALVDYVDYISFTGSTEVGRMVAARAGERLIPSSMELGGKDAKIVLADADLDLAAAAVFVGGCENAGQMCVSIERVYVESPIYDEFVERVRQYAQEFTLGNGDGFDIHMGSMTAERELNRVESQIEDAVQKGAQLVSGGQRRPDLGPLFIEPGLLTGVDHTMRVMTEETFGPLIPIMKVANADEAVRLANENEYGLSGAIFTRDLRRGEEIALRLNTGDVTINRTNMVPVSPHLPWGGQKNSGLGRRGGPEGLLRFVHTQSIVTDRQLFSWPHLTPLDPLTLWFIKTIRVVRRYFPFI